MGFSGSLPLCVTIIDIICMFINWANKDACLLALYKWTLSDYLTGGGASNARGVRRPISRFISDMMRDRAIVTIEGE